MILDIQSLTVRFKVGQGMVHAVDDVSLGVAAGAMLGVVGESGSGKSQLFKSICRLSSGHVAGRVIYDGQDILALGSKDLNRFRGGDIAYVFQDSMTALNPFLRLRVQLAEVAERHLGVSRSQAVARARDLLVQVRIPDPDRVLASYPHELSGGMRQRVVIAMALMGNPRVLIADEPTTALDATVQLQILRLLKTLNEETGVSVVLISHDMGVVSAICDEIAVMYAGRLVERNRAATLLSTPRHPYTRRLIDSMPDVAHPRARRLEGIPGTLPAADAPRSRCLFADRCLRADTPCRQIAPALAPEGGGAFACHHPLEIAS